RGRFSDWPDKTLEKGPTGGYTLWNEQKFFYAGISYKDAKDALTNPQAAGVWGRLNHHARGFGESHLRTYVAERYVIPDLTRGERESLRRGAIRMSEKISDYIRNSLTYRVVICT